jgi:hypothetical protein
VVAFRSTFVPFLPRADTYLRWPIKHLMNLYSSLLAPRKRGQSFCHPSNAIRGSRDG